MYWTKEHGETLIYTDSLALVKSESNKYFTNLRDLQDNLVTRLNLYHRLPHMYALSEVQRDKSVFLVCSRCQQFRVKY